MPIVLPALQHHFGRQFRVRLVDLPPILTRTVLRLELDVAADDGVPLWDPTGHSFFAAPEMALDTHGLHGGTPSAADNAVHPRGGRGGRSDVLRAELPGHVPARGRIRR